MSFIQISIFMSIYIHMYSKVVNFFSFSRIEKNGSGGGGERLTGSGPIFVLIGP